MNAQAPADPKSQLVLAWNAWQQTEDFASSFRLAVAENNFHEIPAANPFANSWTIENHRAAVLGALWNAFQRGFLAQPVSP